MTDTFRPGPGDPRPTTIVVPREMPFEHWLGIIEQYMGPEERTRIEVAVGWKARPTAEDRATEFLSGKLGRPYVAPPDPVETAYQEAQEYAGPPPGLVIREVKREMRQGRGHYWNPNGAGYTDEITAAGLYEPGSRTTDRNYEEVDAVDAYALAAAERRGNDGTAWRLPGLRILAQVARRYASLPACGSGGVDGFWCHPLCYLEKACAYGRGDVQS